MVQYTPHNILLTGGAGFIGSHVATRLVQEYPQYNIIVFDKLDYCATLNNLSSIKGRGNFKFVEGDIQSSDLLKYVLEKEQIDTVMHFAAQTHVDNSFGNSLTFTMNNTYGTHVLLESCRQYGKIRRFINVSTDEVYGETSLGKDKGLTEQSRLEPTNPYSAAKAGAEMLALAYGSSYKLPVIVTRGNNVYGPGQFPEKLVPKFTVLASRGLQLPIHGDGESVRSYLFVGDVARAFDIVLHQGRAGETYNIGTNKERTVTEVARDICSIFNLDSNKVMTTVRDRAFNDRRYFICDSKLSSLGWNEETSWEDGLRQTVDWYLKHGNKDYFDNGNLELALQAHPYGAPVPSHEIDAYASTR
ncbi:putative Trifunctional UDP-glucose 4,6-dehydratase/UDP-4-keto-6-deoxy-D-glucose 3,5-epimerase/UDP-4-keto-L-rhamnose-reductase RHM1 [Nannochloris sp. 'desiccata']|nr:putative Trifunctional UDP-glucose 4,6-dehydratase/UDP-4-keto-6-deoxy-D-glucose 3,5-epimerase/UDP-4-keto-L-rhamnose-reductase RHM1 [Chlorella desiccata (nom. nud.)]